MRVAVVGATGLLGAPVAKRLVADGFEVRAIVREPGAARARIGVEVELVAGDVTRPATLATAVAGCDALYVSLRGRNDVASYDAIEVQGVRNLVRAARDAGLERIVYISGSGRTDGNAAHFPVRVKTACEQALRDGGVPFTVLRPTHFMESLPRFVRGRRATVLGRQPHRYHYLAADDYAGLVSLALREPRAAGRTLTVFGPEPYTMREALQVFTRIALPGVAVDHLPLTAARAIAALTGNRDLRFAAQLFACFAAIGEDGDATETVRLLGPATTTLERWARDWLRTSCTAAAVSG